MDNNKLKEQSYTSVAIRDSPAATTNHQQQDREMTTRSRTATNLKKSPSRRRESSWLELELGTQGELRMKDEKDEKDERVRRGRIGNKDRRVEDIRGSYTIRYTINRNNDQMEQWDKETRRQWGKETMS